MKSKFTGGILFIRCLRLFIEEPRIGLRQQCGKLVFTGFPVIANQ